MDENQWKRRLSAMATNAIILAMQKHSRTMFTDEDAARRDAIYQLLHVSPSLQHPGGEALYMRSELTPELDKALTELMASIPSKPNG